MTAYGGDLDDYMWGNVSGAVWLEWDTVDGGGAEELCRCSVLSPECLMAVAEGVERGTLLTDVPGEWAHVMFVPGEHDELDDEEIEQAAVIWLRRLPV